MDGKEARGRTVTQLTDPRALRAYAHPGRMALLGLLRREGPLTATRAAELLGESSGTCSFHLRQLAKYGLVEEAGGGTGREKPWRAGTTWARWGGPRGGTRGAARGARLAELGPRRAVLRAADALAGGQSGRAGRVAAGGHARRPDPVRRPRGARGTGRPGPRGGRQVLRAPGQARA